MREATAGDREALERLLLHAQDVAWRFSMTVCGGADDAEDAMQEALLRTYRHVDQIREPEAFRPWLYRTVRNACLMKRRRRVDEPAHFVSLDEPASDLDGPGVLGIADPGRSPEEAAANARLRQELRDALHALPAPARAVVFLREVEGLSTREVARVLELTEDTVKQRLHRARLVLRRRLGNLREDDQSRRHRGASPGSAELPTDVTRRARERVAEVMREKGPRR